MEYTPFYCHYPDIYESFGQGLSGAGDPCTGLPDMSAETEAALRRGKDLFSQRLASRTLLPRTRFSLEEVSPETIKPEIHNYTGRCPALTYEINPVLGCGVGCQYCLVSDGVHERELVAIDNYHLYVRRLLEEKNGPGSGNQPHYYYFSPKTEAFQEATLLSGIAHRILHEFEDHYRRCPDSNARLFIASKAGARHLLHEWGGESVLDIFARLRERMQFNTSVSIMTPALRDLLEPYSAPIEERLKAVALCRERGVQASSALVQPIFIPCLTDDEIKRFFTSLNEAGIVNYKPEFLTVCPENLYMLGRILGLFDPGAAKELCLQYLSPSNADHRKQRFRTAPSRDICKEALRRIRNFTDTLGMSISICYWVRMQLGISEEDIPLVNRNGYQCLGYQRNLFG